MLRLNSLLLRNFRNYRECRLDFHPRLNIICGDNAQGKTNLLEAVAYLSLGSSFREQNEDKIKRWNADFFFLKAELCAKDGAHILSAGYQQRRRFWKKDEQPCRKISEIAGLLHTVVFQPEDLELVKKGPEVRRHFLDREMIQLYRGYHLYLNNYKKALLQRNNFLKQLELNTAVDDELSVWEEQLTVNGAVIVKMRYQMIKRLNMISRQIHGELSGGAEELRLEYISPLSELTADEAENETVLVERLRQLYAAGRSEDIRRRQTLLGPHRDDFRIYINDVEGRYFGSQGQQRTAALALKLSEVELVRQVAGYYPLLLLDDVFSELDAGRRQALLRLMLHKAQIFITATEVGGDMRGLPKEDYYLFRIQDGEAALQK
ncbi:MAG TPA: DNA replication/repair protein RecF [Candidatus Avidehalobacter gallistercoris]|uniref:DNA replication and repair protein RecF n=1 Tax=Candidatus Avidehalobacter gallistercoris TaxID=2840694 RepID=A0A9D1KYE7_9FIRM|nr:DNA replication/repair protein RecF [Candidatus Avidehalobacter gallistercoris]